MTDEDANHFVLRCRGLPWSTTVDEIANFFSDCKFKEGHESVHLTLTREGRPSGEAYIELETEEDLEKALKKDKQHMGKRYIEGQFYLILLEKSEVKTDNIISVFKSKHSEMDWVVKRSGKGDYGSPGGGNGDGRNTLFEDSVVRLRGLPFDSTQMDIVKFFDGKSQFLCN